MIERTARVISKRTTLMDGVRLFSSFSNTTDKHQ